MMTTREAGARRKKIDFAIITIRTDEHDAVLRRFPGAELVRGRQWNYHIGQCSANGGIYRVAITRCARQGEGEAQQVANSIIDDLRPRWILTVGIAGGIPDSDFCLGDVVVSNQVYDLTVTAELPGGDREYSLGGAWVSRAVDRVFATLTNNQLGDWNNEESIGLKRPEVTTEAGNLLGDREYIDKITHTLDFHFKKARRPVFVTRPIISSGTLMRNPDIVRVCQTFMRHFAAFEMEFAGVFHAARRSKVDYPVLTIRGISDIVGVPRSEHWTKYACETAAAFTHAFIMRAHALPFHTPRIRRKREQTSHPISQHDTFPDHFSAVDNLSNSREDNPIPQFVIPPLPEVDAEEVSDDRFFGREGILEDFHGILDGVIHQRRASSANRRPVQLIWYHGFGGLGKSSLLRRAYIEANKRHKTLKIAFIDWYTPLLRYPIEERVLEARDLYEVVAVRLHQLYGSTTLEPFWHIHRSATSREAIARRSTVDSRFELALRAFESQASGRPADDITVEGGAWQESGRRERDLDTMRAVMQNAGINPKTSDFSKRMRDLRDRPIIRDQILQRWGEKCLSAADASDLVLRPDHAMASALQQCFRLAVAQAPLLLMFDTHEMLQEAHDETLRQLFAPLLFEKLPFLVVIAGRFAPDAAGWLSLMPEPSRRVKNFGDDVYFTNNEIAAALQRVHPNRETPPALAASIYRATRGMPLAVGMLFDDYRRNAHTFDDWEFTDVDENQPPEAVLERITSEVTRRILIHLDWDDMSPLGDLASIFAMTVVANAEREILEELWRDIGYSKHVEHLRRVHSFIIGNDLHVDVKKHFRQFFRTQPPGCSAMVLRRLKEINEGIIFSNDPGQRDYFARSFQRLNIDSWLNGDESLPTFLPELLLRLTYHRSAQDLLELANEIPTRNINSDKIKNLLFSWHEYPTWFDPWDNSSFKRLREYGTSQWSVPARASLALLLGLEAAEEKNHPLAIERLSAAVLDLGATCPRRQEVSEAFVEAASNLADLRAVQAAFHASETLGISFVSHWTSSLYGWHDDLNRRERSDSDSLTRLSGWVAAAAEGLFDKLAAAKTELDLDDFDPSPLILFQAHMLARHAGRREDATLCYRKVRVDKVEDCVDVLQMEYAQYLSSEGRASDAAKVINFKSERSLSDLVDVLLPGLNHLSADSPLRATLEKVIAKRNLLSELSDVNQLCALALLFTRLGMPEANSAAERAISLADDKNGQLVNHIAWSFYMNGVKLREVSELARRAAANDPNNIYLLQTSIALMIRGGLWEETIPGLQRWATTIDLDHLLRAWRDFMLMFRDLVRNGRAHALTELLIKVNRPEAWGDLITALRILAGDAVDQVHITAKVNELTEQLSD
jgi:nucleoside phosphorylase